MLAGFNRVKMTPKGPDRQRILTHAYDEHVKSCGAYPEAWAGFVIVMMDELCRASECKKDHTANSQGGVGCTKPKKDRVDQNSTRREEHGNIPVGASNFLLSCM